MSGPQPLVTAVAPGQCVRTSITLPKYISRWLMDSKKRFDIFTWSYNWTHDRFGRFSPGL